MKDTNNLSKRFPLYINLANTLKEKILKDFYKVGELLPTEDVLQREFSTSRTTVRSAIELLEKQGYVKRFQGRGTEICSRNPTQNLNYLSSISGTLTKRYGTVQTGSCTLTKSIPPPDIQVKFKIKENEKVYSLSRTKVVDGKIIAYIKNFLLPRVIPNLEDYLDYVKEYGLYKTLEEKYNLKLGYGKDNISVYMSGPLDSEIFEEHSSIPLYCTKRNTFLENGTLFEVVTAFIRAEDFEYTVYLKGRP